MTPKVNPKLGFAEMLKPLREEPAESLGTVDEEPEGHEHTAEKADTGGMDTS